MKQGLILLLTIPTLLFSQQKNKYTKDAFMIMRVASKAHVQPKNIDELFALTFYDRFLKAVDKQTIIFNQLDLQQLAPFKKTILTDLLNQKPDFLFATTTIVEKRLQQIDSILSIYLTKPFNLDLDEYYTAKEDSTWAPHSEAQFKKITKQIKYAVLTQVIESDEIDPKKSLSVQKKLVDSLEISARRKIINNMRRSFIRMQQGAIGLSDFMGIAYCETLATMFDPHSNYMPKTLKENFQSGLGKKAFKFGFSLEKEDDEDAIEIADLTPGSAAHKSGQLNKGDKIIAVQWEGKNPIDVSQEGLKELSAILDQSNHDKLSITVKKKDGTTKKVDLFKEQTDTEDEGKVKGFILHHQATKIGYISLPIFYTDWDNTTNNVNGCANDVAREIIQLKKENIDGLILDLRYNGGGSLKEAVELSGLFIDAGPVTMLNRANEKTITIKDINRGTVWDGPLAILVNGASASASELFAAAMQDYRRAVVIGTTTYGKATGQTIYPLDTSYNGMPLKENSNADSYIKLTIDKLYRINGTTLQAQGVIPDITMPSLFSMHTEKEADNPTALKTIAIEPNKFYTPYPITPILSFIERAKEIIDTAKVFRLIKNNRFLIDSLTRFVAYPLQIKKAYEENEKKQKSIEQITTLAESDLCQLSVASTKAEAEKIKVNSTYKEAYDQWAYFIGKDLWIQLTVSIFKPIINK